MMNVLYKLDSAGRRRILTIETDGAEIVQCSGLLDGNLVENRSLCHAKNIGRANETTAAQQAVLEADSKITEKLKEGYFYTIEEAENSMVILPMLAKDYKKEFKKVQYPCYVQPKLDGMRCLGSASQMRSRTNGIIDTMEHIQKELRRLEPSCTLDGELYAHGLNFQENMRLIKKVRPESFKIVYHVYDCVSDLPFADRNRLLRQMIYGAVGIELVPTFTVNNEGDMKHYHAKFLNEGYEGTIIRWGDSGYEANKRSSSLLKYKDFVDITLPVLDVIPMAKRPDHGEFIFEWEGAKGHPEGDNILGAGMKFSHEERSHFLTNKHQYVGKTAELRFFEYSETGVPRFPVCVGLRLDK